MVEIFGVQALVWHFCAKWCYLFTYLFIDFITSIILGDTWGFIEILIIEK